MSAQCYEHRFGYCTNVKTCFNVHFRPILAEKKCATRVGGCTYQLVRITFPLPQTIGRGNGLNLLARAMAPHQKYIRSCDIRGT